MQDIDVAFSGSIAELYDNYLVPLIFQGYADDLAGHAAGLKPKAVLETAAGTGVVTRALAARLPSDMRLVATDLNQPMLDHAARRLAADGRISWRQCDALNLPFKDSSFDVVVCQFGVMFFPDKVSGYREARRVLKPGGTFLFNAWDRIEANELPHLVTQVLASLFPDDPPRFLARIPYGYHDPEVIRDELEQAGFKDVSLTTIERRCRAPSPRHVAVAFCQGTPLRAEIEARAEGRLEFVTDRVTEAIAERYGTGSVAGKIRAQVIEARRW